MSVAAVDDVIAWCALAITLALIRSTDNISILWTILLILAELVFMVAVVGPLIRWLVSRDKGYTHLNADTFLILSLILIGCSYLAEVIGLSALIGAFQVGLLIPRTSNLVCVGPRLGRRFIVACPTILPSSPPSACSHITCQRRWNTSRSSS